MPETPKNKYLRKIASAVHENEYVEADVYSVLDAFTVYCPAQAHAAKKVLCAGQRLGGKDLIQDLEEAIVSLQRAIELAKIRKANNTSIMQMTWTTFGIDWAKEYQEKLKDV